MHKINEYIREKKKLLEKGAFFGNNDESFEDLFFSPEGYDDLGDWEFGKKNK